jgi:DNA polymerase-3 subunit beta
MTATLEDMKRAEAVSKASVTASAAAWLEALAIVRMTHSRKAVIPVLGCVLIEATDSRVTLTTNNYEASISADVADAVSEKMTALLPLQLLVDAIKVTSDKGSEVTITLLDFLDKQIAVVASEGFKYPIVMHHSIDEFPRFAAASGGAAFSIGAAALKSAIKRTAVASSKDRTLPILTSLHFVSDPAASVLQLEATDRYRLASVREPAYVNRETNFLLDFELLLKLSPKIKQKTPVSFVVDDANPTDISVKIIFDRFVLSMRCIGGDYPKLQKLFADSYEHSFTVNRVALVRAATVAQRLSVRHCPATFELLGDRLLLKPSRDGLDVMSAGLLEVPAITMSPRATEQIDFAVSPTYLLDAIKLIEDDVVTISLNSTVKPIIFAGEQGAAVDSAFRYLLMPVRMPS